jgi:hypothetical protein
VHLLLFLNILLHTSCHPDTLQNHHINGFASADFKISHGRDNSLRIWQLRASDEPTLSTILPAEDATTPRPKPWLLYTLPVNTLNFCALSMCHEQSSSEIENGLLSRKPVLIATPATDDKKINVYQFPDEKLGYVVPRISTTDSGEFQYNPLHPKQSSFRTT